MTTNPEIRNTQSKFCPIYGDWGELGIENLERMPLMKCYWMLQDARVTSFTVFEGLRENQREGSNYPPPPPTQITVKYWETRGRLLNSWKGYQKLYIVTKWFSENVQTSILVAEHEGWIEINYMYHKTPEHALKS